MLLNEITNRGLKYRSTIQIIRVHAVSLVTSVKDLRAIRSSKEERESRSELCLFAIRLSRISHVLPRNKNYASVGLITLLLFRIIYCYAIFQGAFYIYIYKQLPRNILEPSTRTSLDCKFSKSRRYLFGHARYSMSPIIP